MDDKGLSVFLFICVFGTVVTIGAAVLYFVWGIALGI